jgi:formylglycine-generating enzyme required for sulfatase activity
MTGRWVDPEEEPSAEPLDPLLRTYCSGVQARLDYLEFGDPAELLEAAYRVTVPRQTLADIWIPPMLSEAGVMGVTGVEPRVGLELQLDRVLELRQQLVVILAQPGGGKSTLSRFLAVRGAAQILASGAPDGIIIYVPVAKLDLTGSAIEEAIAAAAADAVGLGRMSSDLVGAMTSVMSRAIFVVDGLDEASVAPINPADGHRVTRSEVIGAVRFLLLSYRGSRCIVTCREADYVSDAASVFGEASHYRVGGFGPDQVHAAIAKWHRCAESAAMSVGIVASLPWSERADMIRELLRSDSSIGTLATVPLLLNMFQVVYAVSDELPRSISQLCNRAVKFLMVDKHKMESDQGREATRLEPTKGETHAPPLSDAIAEHILVCLERVAFRIHERASGTQDRGLTPDELHAVVRETVLGPRARSGDDLRKGNEVEQVYKHIVRGHGVLAESESPKWDFTHNVFREVLAGRALKPCSTDDRINYAVDEKWHLPLRYWAGTLVAQGEVDTVTVFASDLLDRSSRARGKRRMSLLLACAEILSEATAASAPGSTLAPRLIVKLKKSMVRLLNDSTLPLAKRVRLGDLLGALGDPRLAGSPLDLPLVPIGAGSYTIGRTSLHQTNNTKYLQCPAAPEFTASVDAFRVALVLTTNRDYNQFLSSGGYSELRWWHTDEARAWVTQDESFLSELSAVVDNTALTHFMTELTAGRIIEDDIQGLRDRILKRHVPLYWYDSRFNRPCQPVVGVNWWEASAYCAWLEARFRGAHPDVDCHVRLPTEIEWEVAARGPQNAMPYPWGTASALESSFVGPIPGAIGRSCGVGLFPWARWESGPLDIVGNVWEWTSAPLSTYAEAEEAARSTAGLVDRMVRGSSWLSTERESPEVTFRSFDPPCNAYADLGFRLAYDGCVLP